MGSSVVPFWCANYSGNTTVYLIHYYCSKIEVNLTSCATVQSESEMETIRLLCESSKMIWYAVFWFSIVVGFVGNSLAFFTVASLPVSIATFFVGLLAVSDFIAILLRMTIYFLNKEKLINPTTPHWHIFPLLFDFSMSYSNWLLVLICVDRFISIRYPLKRRFYFTLRHAKIASFAMGVILFTIYFIAVQILGYMDVQMFTVRNLLYSVLPLIFIVILIVLIAIQFRIIHRKRKLLQEGGSSSSANQVNSPYKNRTLSFRHSDRATKAPNGVTTPLGGGSCKRNNSQNNHGSSRHQQHHNHSNHRHRHPSNVFEDIERLENNITIMMLITAIVFALLTIPNCVLLFTYRHASEQWNTPLARARWHVFSKTSQVLTFLNLSINFFLYFLSAKKFRSQLCRLLRLRRRESTKNNTPLHNNTLLPTQNDSETFL